MREELSNLAPIFNPKWLAWAKFCVDKKPPVFLGRFYKSTKPDLSDFFLWHFTTERAEFCVLETTVGPRRHVGVHRRYSRLDHRQQRAFHTRPAAAAAAAAAGRDTFGTLTIASPPSSTSCWRRVDCADDLSCCVPYSCPGASRPPKQQDAHFLSWVDSDVLPVMSFTFLLSVTFRSISGIYP